MLAFIVSTALYGFSLYHASRWGYSLALWDQNNKNCPYDRAAFVSFILGILSFVVATAVLILNYRGW